MCNRSIFAVAGAVLAASMFAASCEHRSDGPYEIASDSSVPGKGHNWDCMEYASALAARLSQHGIHGRLIFYHWRIVGDVPKGFQTQGNHVFVTYYPNDIDQWVVDNEHSHPIQVPRGAPDVQLIYALNADNPAAAEVEVNQNFRRSTMTNF